MTEDDPRATVQLRAGQVRVEISETVECNDRMVEHLVAVERPHLPGEGALVQFDHLAAVAKRILAELRSKELAGAVGGIDRRGGAAKLRAKLLELDEEPSP